MSEKVPTLTPMSSQGIRLLTGRELHHVVIEEHLLLARSQVWIATADLKDMHVRSGRRFKPVLDLFDTMAERGVNFRIIHSAMPSKYFRDTLETCPRLVEGALELQICPRSHWKIVIVDSVFAYCGSANFTGAGLGAKSADKRNLEIGVVSSDQQWVRRLENLFDQFWIGEYCDTCRLKHICPDPVR